MKWTFDVRYKSGREEQLVAHGPARANEIRTDLDKMKRGGHVSDYKVATIETKEGESRKPLATYLKPDTIQKVAASAAANNRSLSAEIAAQLGDGK